MPGGPPVSVENELYGIREILGGLRADVSNIRQAQLEHKDTMATELASVKKDVQEIKENRAAIRGGWYALTGIVSAASIAAGSIGAFAYSTFKAIGSSPPTP